MAMRWASGVLVGMGMAGLLPSSAAAQGGAEPMPMYPPGMWNPAPQGAGMAGAPGMPGMPGMGGMPAVSGMPYPGAMPPGGMPYPGGMPGMPGPMPGGMPPGMPGGMPPGMDPMMMGGGFPGMPAINPASCGPNGGPGVDLQMGATYYPGISGYHGLKDCLRSIFYCESGERRALYGKVGYLGLTRNSLPDKPLIALEAAEVLDFTDPFDPFFRPTTDGDPTGLFTTAPFIMDLASVSPRLHNGVQFAIGLQDNDENCMIEVGGYYAAFGVRRRQFTAPGRLSSPYFNAPEGFQDTAGLWLNADYMQVTYGNSIYSGEINARWFGSTWKCFDVNYLVGLRYIKLYDRLTHYTIDDDLQFFVDDPTTRAELRWKAENDMVGAQVGFGLTSWLTPVWSVSYDQKIAFLGNAARSANRLVRDDNFVGYDTGHTTWRFASAYEGGLFLGLGTGSWRLRAGYEYKLFVGVATVDQNFSYDLDLAATRHRSTDTILYHGPSASIEFVF